MRNSYRNTGQRLKQNTLKGSMTGNRKKFNFLPHTSPVIILGMHRSGTSLLTGLLAECGLYFGKDLDRNHESRTFKNLNEFLMNSTGGNWDYPASMGVLEKDRELRNLYLEYLKGQINSPRCLGYIGWGGIFKSKPIHWGWKDPRNSFTLGIWNELYPSCKAIVIERHGLDVALSLIKRRKNYLIENTKKLTRRSTLYSLLGKRGTFADTARCWSLVEGVRLWSEYTAKAREESYKLPERYLLIKYENFVSSPVSCIKNVLDFVGINFHENTLDEICSKVEPKKAFAYRCNKTIQRLTPSEQKVIKDLLAPVGYIID